MVAIGNVETFRDVRVDKEQALKVLEEAAEVFGALQHLQKASDLGVFTKKMARELLDECADVMQATCNLITALGIEDFTPYMDACRRRNIERGRI